MKHEDRESGIEIKAVNAAVKLIKLQQIMCGVVKDSNGDPVMLDPKNRLELVDELVANSEAKVIIFVPFVNVMHLVVNHLRKNYDVELVNGDVKKTQRDEIFKRFQHDKKLKVLVAHPKVAAHGLTLTAANTIIWYAPTFSIGQYMQANARIDRTGQTLAMSIYNLWCHPVELAIYGLLQARESLQSRVMELYDGALA
jgi:SNF2 family DNA or RNA helicase